MIPNQEAPTGSPVSRFGACLAPCVIIAFLYGIIPLLQRNYPELPPLGRQIVDSIHTAWLPTVFFILSAWALSFQWRIKRIWIETMLMGLSMFYFVFYLAVVFVFVLVRIIPESYWS